jgi:hypothetical protein
MRPSALHSSKRLNEIASRWSMWGRAAQKLAAIVFKRSSTADPAAHFMFHEASLDPSMEPEGGQRAPAVTALNRKAIETFVTDVFYENDIGGQRVNERWLRECGRES